MVYKYKDKSDAAKVHSAPAPGRRVSYSRADNKTYRNTGGASTRAGAELRAKQTFGVPGTDGAEKKKSRKKRLIKRFAIATAVRTINDKKAEQNDTSDKNAEVMATETIQRRMQDAAYVGVELAGKPVPKAARSLYRSVDNKIIDYRARKSVVRTAQRYLGADGRIRVRFIYQSTRVNENIRRVKMKKRQKYRIRTAHGATTPSGAVREQFMRRQKTIAAARAKAAAKKKAATQAKQRQSAQYRTPQSTASKVYSSARNKAGSSVYGPSHSKQTKIRTVQQRKAAATAYNARVRKAAAERSEKSMRYRIKARKAGVKKMKRQQAAKLAGKTLPTNANGVVKKGFSAAMKSAFQFTVRFAKSKALIPILAGVLVMCMIAAPAAMVASVLGLFFADAQAAENDKLSTVQTAYVNAQFAWSEEVLSGESYDQVVYEGNYANDVEVLAVFAVKTTEKDGLDVIEIDDKKKAILAQVYKDMNPYTKWITVVNKTRILHVQINALTADQAADKYEFTKMQRTTLKELLDKYRNDLQGLLNSIFGSAAANLSPEVLALQALVEKYAKQYGISDHVGTLLAIIQVESGGVLADVMQSSESAGLPPGAIKDKEASINQGCKYYAELVKRAKQLGVDGDSIVQAYNYGGGFLDYVAKNGKKYSFELAESFAKQHSGGVRVTYKNAISTAKNGGWRYNYGNMFYVMLVQQYTGGAAYGSETFQKLMTEAKKYIGMPYVFGGSTPQTSFDCSGFICWVYTQSGVCNLPRMTAYGIYLRCTPISASQAQPGDLVFFANTYDCPEPISHIGIYVGNGKMLHCGNPIGYADLSNSYWKSHMYGFARPK